MQDGEKARELLAILTGDSESTRKVLEEGSLALSAHGLRERSVSLMKQCLELDGLPPTALGITCENIAILYRESGKFKLMVQIMKRALEYYRRAGEKYRACVALKNLGEAEWNLGFKQAALQFFASAERQGSELPNQERFDVFSNLSAAARRIGDKKMEIDYLKECLVNLPDDQVDTLLAIERRLNELT